MFCHSGCFGGTNPVDPSAQGHFYLLKGHVMKLHNAWHFHGSNLPKPVLGKLPHHETADLESSTHLNNWQEAHTIYLTSSENKLLTWPSGAFPASWLPCRVTLHALLSLSVLFSVPPLRRSVFPLPGMPWPLFWFVGALLPSYQCLLQLAFLPSPPRQN